jgi:glutathione peroxidase
MTVPRVGIAQACRRAGVGSLAAMSCLLFALDNSQAAEVAARDTRTASPTACPPLLDRTLARLQDDAPQRLCQYAGRVILVVNTASRCGFTGQYAGLETLHRRYRDRGFVVLGFPSNDFGQQEPGNAKQIVDFCFNTYGVAFPMFAKTTVVGPNADPLFVELARAGGAAPGWNFHKYLLARDGSVVGTYPSTVDPLDARLVRDLERTLAR